ncbi:MAG: hypothetical protein M1829_000745 [Trizodia sp. TS-e1964]|nr:MAG: hypothetical protein M1829_000745 [Trizodia sp. TS-e1964]
MAPSSGLWVPLAIRILRHAYKKTSRVIQDKLAQTGRSVNAELKPALVRSQPQHPVHRAILSRQKQARWHSTLSSANAGLRHFSSASATARVARSSLPKSAIGTAVSRLTTRAPFASTLRPNLTGGALPRTAGGYSLGGGRIGGVRYFSHTPTMPAEVISNVSNAARAFWVSGQRAHFDGMNSQNGEKRFKAISTLQDEAGRKMRSIPRHAPGSFVDFHVNPAITALSPLSSTLNSCHYISETSAEAVQPSLHAEGLINVLSSDFARALQDLAVTLADLKRLSTLGDLPLSLPEKSTIRVRFPGCDEQTVEALCDEAGVQRGVIHQDPDFDTKTGAEMALLFPFAPSSLGSEAALPLQAKKYYPARTKQKPTPRRDAINWQAMLSPVTMPSPRTQPASFDFEAIGLAGDSNPWLSPASGYSSLHSSDVDALEEAGPYFAPLYPAASSAHQTGATAYEGVEGIYRFLEQCESAKR